MLQPCDVSFFKSLKWHYDDRAANWLLNHPGRAINEEEMIPLFSAAYGKATSVGNATNGFAKTGIHPFDKMKFEGQYSAAAVTERDRPIDTATTCDSWSCTSDYVITVQDCT